MTEEKANGMTRCSCGLIVADDKMNMHMESEHLVKLLSDSLEGTK